MLKPRQNKFSTMSAKSPIIVLDVGTTNIRVVVFDHNLQQIYSEQEPITTHSPRPDWQEQDPGHILAVCKRLISLAEKQAGAKTAKLGIANQRESVVAWDKQSGKAVSPLILWSDKRTRAYCEQLKKQGLDAVILYKTGLTVSPYSSAPKIHWLLTELNLKDNESLAIGTLDSWLVYKLTGKFLTDYTNASRTMLFNIHTLKWDEELLNVFGVRPSMLAQAVPSRHDFGSYATLDTHLAHHVLAVAGDQQASLYAAGSKPGTVKVTYGTGIFPMRIIGHNFRTQNGYLTTLAIDKDGSPVYALEGRVENAAPRVNQVFGISKPAFDKLMVELAEEAAPSISGLVSKGQTVYVDGGISQNDDILKRQEELNHIKTKRLSTYNGTALGVAALIRDIK